jgi:hypothetical protein
MGLSYIVSNIACGTDRSVCDANIPAFVGKGRKRKASPVDAAATKPIQG